MIRKSQLTAAVIFLTLSAFAGKAGAEPAQQQLYMTFNQACQAFRGANAAADNSEQQKLYEKAILLFEKIITEGQIKNPKLYYDLANTYFLKGDIGRAILNYRRAEKLDSADADIRKNLSFARSRRIDKVKVRTEQTVLKTLLFWHYDFSIKTRFTVTCISFAGLCIFLTVLVWAGRRAPVTAAAVVAAVVFVLFFGSAAFELGTESTKICGVITADEVVARQGDGQNYDRSFKDPLHAGTEFDLLEDRPGWYHIELSDGSDAWIPHTSAELI
jgi:tetratricopeptide (TPR) repeat protein